MQGIKAGFPQFMDKDPENSCDYFFKKKARTFQLCVLRSFHGS